MNVGLVISGLGHGALLIWAMLDWTPRPELDAAIPVAVPVRLVAPEALELAAPQLPPAPVSPRDSAAPDPVAPPPPADRVALLPAPPPPDRAVRSDLPQQAVRPDPVPAPETPPRPPQPAEAPPAAADRRAPQAEDLQTDPTGPVDAPRPGQRPARQAISDALIEALESPPPDATAEPVPTAPAAISPVGPPLTGSERDGLRVAVGRCWNFGALSIEAARVTVTVSMQMFPDGRPDSASLRLAGFEGGSRAAADQAFEVARRAILRCAGDGYPLPREKYGQWQEIEMVFNPDRMRGR